MICTVVALSLTWTKTIIVTPEDLARGFKSKRIVVTQPTRVLECMPIYKRPSGMRYYL